MYSIFQTIMKISIKFYQIHLQIVVAIGIIRIPPVGNNSHGIVTINVFVIIQIDNNLYFRLQHCSNTKNIHSS